MNNDWSYSVILATRSNVDLSIRSKDEPFIMCMINGSCPRCGYCCDTPSVPLEAGATVSLSPKDDITWIKDETRRLDDIISQLRRERALLQRRLNDLQSFTRILPYETLSSIFQNVHSRIDFQIRDFRTEYALKDPYARHTADFEDPGPLVPVTLGAVSALWRQIAWSTHDLWTSFALEVKEDRVHHQTNLLRLYFQNANSRPVSLELDFRKHFLNLRHSKNAKTDGDKLALVHAVILEHAPKIQSLRLSAVPPEWVLSLTGVFTSLENLALGWPTNGQVEPTQEFSFSDILALRRVTIRRLWAPLKLPWSQIVVLDLDRMTIDTCVVLLIECHNLEEYSVKEPSFTPSDRRHPSLDGIITLDNLQVLIWTCLPDAWSIAMLEHVRFSRLVRLEWHGFPGDQNRNRFRDFFSDLPPTLRTLGLSRYDTSEGLQEVLMNISQLTHLELLSCQSRFCRSILQCLTPPLSLQSHDQVLLPLLQRLTFDRCDEIQHFGIKGSLLFRDLFSMLHHRFAAAVIDQGLVLQFNPRIKWRTDAQHILAQLVRDGVVINIMEDSRVASWL